ncbi:MAG: hypothetical protein HKO13_08445 [Sphingomonas sp.]|nr:hypothetical protein [Sphingomonas sp.]RZV52135.1 MAG: hypothetical protein EX258_02580 [Sphingomonadaceae bacterium]
MGDTGGGPEWFYAKRYGWGASLPCAWQGWALLAGYLTIVCGSALLLAERSPLALFAIVVSVTAIFVLIVVKTTKGGVKWRWGKDKGTW